MVQITLTDEQTREMAEAEGRVEIVDATGWHVAFIDASILQEDVWIAKQRRRANEPVCTTEEVLERLRRLEELW